MTFIQIAKKHVENKPFFLILIPVFLLVHIEQEYQYLIPYSFVYSEIIQLLLAMPVFLLLSYILLRVDKKSSLYAAVLLIAFYFFCDLKDWLYTKLPGLLISSYTFLLPCTVVILISVYIFLNKTTGSFKKTFLFINSVFTLFIIADLVAMLFSNSVSRTDLGDHEKQLTKNYQPCIKCVKPDIYYLVADAYTSSEVLRSEFDYNNLLLDSFLAKNGFYVVSRSRSNYNLTPFSIASTFNLNYLPRLNPEKDFYIKEYLPGVSSVYSSELFPLLEKEGYQIINHSTFNVRHHETTIKPFDIWDIYLLYSRHNIFRKINMDIGWLIKRLLGIHVPYKEDPAYVREKDRHFSKTYDALMATSRTVTERPKFVYGHLVLPHLPSAFDSLGNKIQLQGNAVLKSTPEKRYIEMVRFTSKKIISLVESILSKTSRPVVIILQGDHGFRFPEEQKKQLEFANLNAIYFYNQDYRMLNDSVTNVNTFRIVLNTFFKKDLQLLKDSSYFLQYK